MGTYFAVILFLLFTPSSLVNARHRFLKPHRLSDDQLMLPSDDTFQTVVTNSSVLDELQAPNEVDSHVLKKMVNVVNPTLLQK